MPRCSKWSRMWSFRGPHPRPSQSHVIANLIQLYKYDFSEFAEIGSPYGEVGSDGRYTYDGLDSYWPQARRHLPQRRSFYYAA